MVQIALLAAMVPLAACSWMFSPETSLPGRHPFDLGEGRALCGECHEGRIKGVGKPFASFSHSPEFVRNHRLRAARDEQVCVLCHHGSFCNDCHAGKTEIKPSVKLGNRPDRELIHRGDYVSLHMIDGKSDPTSCYRCHGRANNEKCAACHRGGGRR